MIYGCEIFKNWNFHASWNIICLLYDWYNVNIGIN